MFDSKSTRKFSKWRTVVVLIIIIFISDYYLYGSVQSNASTPIQRQSNTGTTIVSSTQSMPTSVAATNSSTYTQTNVTIDSVTSVTSTSITSVNSSVNGSTNLTSSSSTTSGSSTKTSTTSTVSSLTTSSTSSTFASNYQLYTIPMANFRNWFNLSSSNVNFVQSSTQIPYYIVTRSGTAIGLVYLTTDISPQSCWGYNGEIGTIAYVNTTGFIIYLHIYSNPDSWGYKITQTWLNTYINRSVFEELQFGVDAQPVSGATYSSTGVIDGVRDAGRIVVNDYQQQTNGGSSSSASGSALILGSLLNIFGVLETSDSFANISLIALVCLFVAAVVAFELKSDKMKYAVWVGSIFFIGFYTIRMVSMGDFTDFLHLRFPPFWNNLYWYALYGGVLVTSLIWGRFYCGFLCPFGTFTDILNKISPVKLKIPTKYQSKLRFTKYIVLGIVVFEIFQNTILYQVEPFGTLFLFSGDTFAWIFLGLILGTSIFFNRFYCKYICPAGAGMALISSLRMREIKRWPECEKCMICANQCEPQAIKGDHISAFECMNCRGCEKLYLNTKICPHYAKQRILAKKQDQIV